MTQEKGLLIGTSGIWQVTMYLYIFSSTYKNTFPWRNNLCCESAPGCRLVWGGGGAHLRVVMVEVTSPPWVGRSASPPTFPSAWAWMWSFGMAQKFYYVLIQAPPNASVRGFFHEFLLLSVTCSFMAHQGKYSVIFGSLMTLMCDAEFSLFFYYDLADLYSIFIMLIIQIKRLWRCVMVLSQLELCGEFVQVTFFVVHGL